MYNLMTADMTEWFETAFDILWNNSEKFALIPIILTLGALSFLALNYMESGELITTGVDFKGGTEILVDLAPEDRGIVLSRFSESFEDVQQRFIGLGAEQLTAYELPTQLTEEELLVVLNGTKYASFQIQSVGSAVSNAFFTEAQYALVAAFI